VHAGLQNAPLEWKVSNVRAQDGWYGSSAVQVYRTKET